MKRGSIGGFVGKVVGLLRFAAVVLAPAVLGVSTFATTANAREVTPAVEAFWTTCIKQSQETQTPDFYRVRYFGSDAAMARRLLDIIARGEKTVTFTTPWIYEGDRNATPVVGGYSVVTDFEGRPEVLLRTTGVKTMAYSDVTEEESRFEGDGARTLEAWRAIHWRFFTNALKPFGKQPSEDMPVTVEYFEVVCRVTGEGA
jgi:uncharacterized protein YhfF